jgi:hypothetical protein
MTNQSQQTPCRLRIGVTGHRTLHGITALSTCLHSFLNSGYLEALTPEARQIVSTAKNAPITFSIISPLAEGADRLAAQVALQHGCALEALLPMPQEEYEKDFTTHESKREFRELLAQSQRVTVTECGAPLDDPNYRQKSYLRVGEETVARCDILIALWDGEPSRGIGGTADIVALALEQKKPVFIVSTSQPGKVELLNGGTLQAKFISELEAFNSFPIDDAELEACCASTYQEVFASAQSETLPEHCKEQVKTHLIPAYCRASKIAESFQGRYKLVGRLGYLFSTLSVAFMAFAVVFAKHPLFSIPGYIAELCLLASLYIMIHRAEHARVHPGWLENRALAERLRTAFYFVACGELPLPRSGQKPGYRQNQSWVDHAFHQIITGIPDLKRPEPSALPHYQAFIKTAWGQDQITYHARNATKLSAKSAQLMRWMKVCFMLAIAVSIVHLVIAIYGVKTGHHPEGLLLVLEELLSVVAITLPAAGAAVGGYRTLLEQSRIAARSRAMAQHLSTLIEQPAADTPEAFRGHLEQIQELMLIESEDWLALMEHAELERIA